MGIWDFFKGLVKPQELDISVAAQPPPQEPEEELVNIPALDLAKVKFVVSPNYSSRKGDVKHIVLHHTGPGTFSGIVNWLTNKQAKAAAHYVVGTTGQINQLVSTHKEAWHAGRATWQDERIDNHYTIGIEICNPGLMHKEDDGFYYEIGRGLKKYTGKVEPIEASIVYPSGKTLSGYAVPYPEKQIEKVIALCKGLIELYPQIEAKDIITHYEIGYPEGRKNDPFGLDVEYIRRMVFYNG